MASAIVDLKLKLTTHTILANKPDITCSSDGPEPVVELEILIVEYNKTRVMQHFSNGEIDKTKFLEVKVGDGATYQLKASKGVKEDSEDAKVEKTGTKKTVKAETKKSKKFYKAPQEDLSKSYLRGMLHEDLAERFKA